MAQNFDGGKFRRMHGHLENFDEKVFDKFHNVNAHIYQRLVLLERLKGKNSWALSYNNNALHYNMVWLRETTLKLWIMEHSFTLSSANC